MLSNLIFSSTELLVALASLFGLILAIIFVGRYRLGRLANSDLKEHRSNEDREAHLRSRNKYAEVDVLHNSGQFFKIGLIVALSLTVLAVNWTTFEDRVEIPTGAMDMEFDVEMEAPPQTKEPPPPPPPPPPVIEEVPDDLILTDDQQDFTDQSADNMTAISDAPVAAPTTTAPPPPPPPPPPPAIEVKEIFKVVEDMPRFPGCEDLGSKEERTSCAQNKLLEFIYANIQYPPIARENNVQGTVVVRFVVTETGDVDGIEILRDIGAGCGEEAARIVHLMNNMPQKWVPGRQRGHAVPVYFTLPVKFVLKIDP